LIIFKFYYFILPVDGTNVLSPVAPPRITPFGMPLRNVMVNSRVQVSCVIEEGDAPFHIRGFVMTNRFFITFHPLRRPFDPMDCG
jgi:hypothetical protein